MSSNGGKLERRMSRKLVGLVGAVALIAGSALAGSGPAQAVPTGLFEIADGNVVDGMATSPDWGSMFGRPTSTAGETVSVVDAQGMEGPFFVEDMTVGDDLPDPPCDPGQTGDLTVLTGGGSDKNGDALSTWTWTAGDVPAHKDDITNFYGAAAIDDNGHRVLYFGLERSDNKGDSHLDVEFLQAPMDPTVTGDNAINGCPEGSFAGVRTVGDVLLVLDYSGGGAVVDEVRVWNGTSYELPLDSGGNPINLAPIAGLAHNGAGAVDCGDWNCRTPTAVTTTLAAGTFLEGFLDFTGLSKAMSLPLPAATCFAAFNAKSRASGSWNSQLKDIALADIDVCDARITVGQSGVNEVGTNHTITGHVETNANGAFVNAPDGTTIDFSIVGGPGSFVGGLDSCLTTGGTGSCSVAITSATVGTTVVAAATTVQVGPKSVTRTTDGNAGPGGSGNASTIWADGHIAVTPSATNAVNDPHVFTVEFEVTHGAGGTLGLPSIAPSVTPTPTGGVTHTCGSPVTVSPGLWRCTVTINSSIAGAFVASATGMATVSGTGTPSSAVITRSTSVGTTATKTYVTADINLAADGVHEVGGTHPVTGTAFVNPSTGRIPAPDGTVIFFSIASGPGTLSAPSCITAGGTGSCGVNLSSALSGVSVVGASSNVSVGGLTLPVSTTGVSPNSGTVIKRWVDASVAVGPAAATNPLNEAHQFDVTVTAFPSGASPVSFTSIAPTVTPTPGSFSTTCGTPTITGNTATCAVTINSADPGVFVANVTAVVQVGNVSMVRSTNDAVGTAGPAGSDPAVKTYVNASVSAAERPTIVAGVVIDAQTSPAGAGGLARTGTDAATIVYFGAGLVLAGAILVGTSRRLRRSYPPHAEGSHSHR